MNKEIKQKWVEALRSGKYRQGRSRLRSIGEEFCCLGVLCDISGVHWTRGQNSFGYALPFYEASTDEDESAFWLPEGLADDIDQHALADLNDEGKSFHEIADYIEQNL